jgi:lipid II:glycine glycyltransferase (peptidoglycan interpeptide bridge formation enzyme)
LNFSTTYNENYFYMDNMFKSYYFNQTQDWANFWIQANDDSHTLHYLEDQNFACYTYEYPLALGKKFWYIPRGFIARSPFININTWNKLATFINSIYAHAKQQGNVTFIKFELVQQLAQLADPNNHSMSSEHVMIKLREHGLNRSVQVSGKKIQYLETLTLDLEGLSEPIINSKVGLRDAVINFWEDNKDWFEKYFDKRTRYGTRRSFNYDWKVSIGKTKANFEDFYKLHISTSERQHFGIHSKEYLLELFEMSMSQLIVLRDEEEQVQASWFGIISEDSLIHLYGGNSQFSRDNYGQYMLHLTALFLGKQKECGTYDLGGLENGKGFDLFKRGYLGNNINFYGPLDIPVDTLAYNTYKLGRFIKNVSSNQKS